MQMKLKAPVMAVSMLLAFTACTPAEDEGPSARTPPTQSQPPEQTPPPTQNQPPEQPPPPAQNQPPAPDASGGLPPLERSPEVVGVDANSDGIRDDVEAYIADTYETPLQQAAARQFAKVMQDAMLVDKSHIASVKAIAVRGARAVNCIYARFDGSGGGKPAMRIVEELRAVSTNTKPRLLAYLAYSKALDGTAGALPEGDTCE